MLAPSIFGENLFDEFFDDFFDFPVFDDREMKKAQKKLYGRHAANMMKTDVKEQEDIHVKYERGVLRLSIPKPEERKAQIEDKKYIAIEG